MKTITNKSKKARVLACQHEPDTGELMYFFLLPNGKVRTRSKDPRTGKIVVKEYKPQCVSWTMEVAAGESVQVPTHKETYHQSAMRSGEFRTHRQWRKTS